MARIVITEIMYNPRLLPGLETNQTLDFIERCSVEWSVPITWVEYRYEGRPMPTLDVQDRPKRMPGRHYFVEVDYATASRCGERPRPRIARPPVLDKNRRAHFVITAK